MKKEEWIKAIVVLLKLADLIYQQKSSLAGMVILTVWFLRDGDPEAAGSCGHGGVRALQDQWQDQAEPSQGDQTTFQVKLIYVPGKSEEKNCPQFRPAFNTGNFKQEQFILILYNDSLRGTFRMLY